METIDRLTAINNNLTRYFTGKPCKHGHTTERFTSSSGCVECVHPVRRMPIRDHHNNWIPAVPLQVPKILKPHHLEALRVAVQAHIDSTVAAWIEEWNAP